jgi:hypothetical protein
MGWRGMVVAVAIAWAATPVAAQDARYGKGDTGVVNVSASPGLSEGEEPLSVDPRDPMHLSTVANVFQPMLPEPLDLVFGGGGVQDTRVYVSLDGGAHWTTKKLDQGGLGPVSAPLAPTAGFSPEFSDALNIVNSDADTVWDAQGNVYFESGDIHGIDHGGREVATVWRSSDGGRTWGPPNGTTAIDATEEHDELDRPWLAAGRDLYIAFETSPFVDDPPRVLLKRSIDGGRTWSDSVRVDGGTYRTQFNPRNRPVVGAGGRLFIVYDEAPPTVTPFFSQTAPIHLVVATSRDGGRSFDRSEADGAVQRVDSPEEALPGYAEMIPAIAADPRRKGRVAVAWPQSTGAGRSRILLRWSRNGGRTWSGRIDVADDPPQAAVQHDHVTLAWARDGRLFAGWRDRRCCGGAWDASYQQWVRVLNPAERNRLTPGRTVEFTDGPQPGNTRSGRGAAQPDEFQGLVATRIGVGLTWSQLNGRYDDLMFRRVPLRAFRAQRRAARGRQRVQ